MRKALYTGSFDPPTYGHMNVVEQALELFDEVVVAVMINSSKKPFFSIEERMEMLEEIYKNYQNVKIVSGGGAAVDLALLHDCKAMIRGMRGVTDFEYELQMATINRKLNNEVSTVSLFPDVEVQHISSSVVRELYGLDKNLDEYVHPYVKEKLMERKNIC